MLKLWNSLCFGRRERSGAVLLHAEVRRWRRLGMGANILELRAHGPQAWERKVLKISPNGSFRK